MQCTNEWQEMTFLNKNWNWMLNMKTVLKIATLNLCLGLKFKKDLAKNILLENDIDVLSMQETEIESDFDFELLNIPGYSFEFEVNNVKSWVGSDIKNTIKYERCFGLEGENKTAWSDKIGFQ